MHQPRLRLTDQAFAALLAKARRTNAKRDADERAFGWVAPGDDGVWQHLRTAMAAIEAGMRIGDWDCLEPIEQAICPPDFRQEKGT